MNTILQKNLNEIPLTEFAWLAGIIDGEGCIYIHKCGPNKNKGEKNSHYSLRIRVAMTHFPTIKKICEVFGGIYSEKVTSKENHKNQACWDFSGKQSNVLQFLEIIAKFSITKLNEILIAIEFIKLPKGISFRETPVWLNEKREELFILIKELKKYSFKTTPKKEKILKKNQYKKCPKCGKEIPAFHNNGQIKIACSRKCSIYKRCSDEEERNIYLLYSEHNKSIRNLSKELQIPEGTIRDIIKRQCKPSPPVIT